MFKFLTILFMLALALAGKSQVPVALKKLLKSGDAPALIKYIDNYGKFEVYWHTRREIMPGYEERAILINAKAYDGAYRTYGIIHILNTGKKVIYYDIEIAETVTD